jgi:hypothetical protein
MAGVFINYRVADNPLGAAGIHDGLVRLFGKDMVFRDCVSMEAGTFYPRRIWTALADADVVVAVIGPQWLATTDDVGGIRLIDRPRDWVRRELAWAFRHDTQVLPVLLKDTPADARLPGPAELPDDIRKLALIQALSFSPFRFGEDLDRLAGALVDLAPALGPAALRVVTPRFDNGHPTWPPLSKDAFSEVVDALAAVPCLERRYVRQLIVERLRPEIAVAIQHFPDRHTHVVEILRKCMNYDGGVTELLSLIWEMDKSSMAWRQLMATVHRLLPGTEG